MAKPKASVKTAASSKKTANVLAPPAKASVARAKAAVIKDNQNSRKPVAHPTENLIGQSLGTKGQQTRERLILAIEKLLQTKPLRDIRQADVCRAAGVSPPGFYVYFPDVETLMLEAAAHNQVLPAELQRLLEEAWEPAETYRKAHALISAYVAFWERHYHLLKARNLAADEGDQRMSALRLSFQVPIMEHVAAKIAAGQARTGKRDVSPLAAATIVIASLERLAPVARAVLRATVRTDLKFDDLIDAEAWVLATMIGAD